MSLKIPPTILIKAQTLPEAWEQALIEVLNKGLMLNTQYGIKSIDACSVIEVTKPFSDPMLHKDFPTKVQHMAEYAKQWERGYNWRERDFAYNYTDRLTEYPTARDSGTYYAPQESHQERFIDQLDQIKTGLSGETSRRLQAITWVPSRDLFANEDQPCLQRLWMRNLGDNTCELHTEWRSRDLFTAWNSNMVGLLKMVEKTILKPTGFKLVKLVDFCDSLHIYETDWKAARVTISETISL